MGKMGVGLWELFKLSLNYMMIYIIITACGRKTLKLKLKKIVLTSSRNKFDRAFY